MLKRRKGLAIVMICSLLMSQATIVKAADISSTSNKESINKVITDVKAKDDFYDSVNKNWLNTSVVKDGQFSNSATG